MGCQLVALFMCSKYHEAENRQPQFRSLALNGVLSDRPKFTHLDGHGLPNPNDPDQCRLAGFYFMPRAQFTVIVAGG